MATMVGMQLRIADLSLSAAVELLYALGMTRSLRVPNTHLSILNE
jgi:hypothetical protein